MLYNFYPIQTHQKLQKFFEYYIKVVLEVASYYSLDIKNFEGDHLGLQTISRDDFDQCHEILIAYSELMNAGRIHGRRNNIYRLQSSLSSDFVSVPAIEIFEPKPSVDISKLKPGIEHIAFVAKNFDDFLIDLKNNNIPIDKEVTIGNSSFFKTKFINLVEIEFRTEPLMSLF